MKQYITIGQLHEYLEIGESGAGELNIDKFDRLRNSIGLKETEVLVEAHISIGKMIEILQEENTKVILDNCIPASVKDVRNNKEYLAMELCDALWELVCFILGE